jgi:site-specific DNA recombinase
VKRVRCVIYTRKSSEEGLEQDFVQQPLEVAIPVKLKRSGPAMRLILPNGQNAIAQTDDTLITAIAKAHAWWAELLANPEWRLDDLAAKHGLNPSWATRTIRLAFLDPSIVEKICAGSARASLSFETLRHPENVPALWSEQRALHLG